MPDPGIPLDAYRDTPGLYGVRFECRGCGRTRDADLEKVIARLQATGLGGPHTGVREVGWLGRRRCPRCGASRWETRPVWRPMLG